MKRKKLMIDPGHGGKDSGAVSPTGLKESDVVLKVSLLMLSMLAPHLDVALTRDSDKFLELSERANLANKWGADAFLSIHCNSAENPAEGFEVFTSPGQTASDAFATHLFVNYGAALPGLRKRADLSDGDPDKEARFTVLVKTNMAASLFELEFIHTPKGDEWFRDDNNIKVAARALADGVLEWFGIKALAVGTPAPTPVPAVDNIGEIQQLAKRIVALSQEQQKS